MNAGVAQIEITPTIGAEMSGYIARDGPSIGVQDPLFAKALVIEDGERRVVILTCDLLGLHLAFVEQVRVAIAETTGIPASHVMITCTHTHAGPATLFLQDCGTPEDRYMTHLHDALVAVTVMACGNLQRVRIAVSHGHVTELVHNRRTPGAVIDPDLGVLRICDGRGQVLAIVLNYACHPTCLGGDNRLISAEYPGYVVKKVEAATGAVALFITGAIGDVGPATRGQATLETIGEAICKEALRVLAWLDEPGVIELAESSEVDAAVRKVDLPLLPLPTVAEWEQEVEKWQQIEVAPDTPLLPAHPKIPVAMRNWAARMCDLSRRAALPTNVTSEVQLIRIGDQACAINFVSAPGELFVELGLALKAQAGPHHLFVCGFGNDDIGYIPTRHAYPQGGYEINEAYKYYGYPTALAPEAGEIYVATALELLLM